jgi:hypothetical protein
MNIKSREGNSIFILSSVPVLKTLDRPEGNCSGPAFDGVKAGLFLGPFFGCGDLANMSQPMDDAAA